jgi:deoxyribodipyrimidine photo-lyase
VSLTPDYAFLATLFWKGCDTNKHGFRAKYFESMLIDCDVHSNYGNWMFNAGIWNDPRDRIFNIKRQADMYDPKGEYQKLWL